MRKKKTFDWNHFIPKSIICLQEGYTKKGILNDLIAGISVGVIALPLAMAFAIGSGLSPERGIYTAIIAGFLISALGGSRVQIGGPTGAFVVIVFDIVQRQGYEGLIVATLIAGIILLLMGFFRLGGLLKFIPYPVITGFTSGIALIIFTSQIKDFLGLSIPITPSGFVEQWSTYWKYLSSYNFTATILAIVATLMILFFRRYYPKMPGAIIAVIFVTLLVVIFRLPVETIQSKFGGIPRDLPSPTWPSFSLSSIRALMPDAITIALLAAIESLLSAVVADGMTGRQHKSNCELVAQGIANMGSVLFGGIPATGAIARTATNIRLGGKTPLSGMVHAITLLLILLFLAPLAAQIPLCALAAILVVVAWNMSELDHFIDILKTEKGDAAILLVTFGLTILIDLTVAVEVGVLLAAVIFMKRMSDASHLQIYRKAVGENINEETELSDREAIYKKEIPPGVKVFELEGPLFFGASDLFDEAIRLYEASDKIFILRLRKMMLIDASGLHALEMFKSNCHKRGVILVFSEIREQIKKPLIKAGIIEKHEEDRAFDHIDEAIDFACKNSIS